jgi:hypothetical protein
MTAILDPVGPDVDGDIASSSETVVETHSGKDRIPLESMTWPELKRVARALDLKLNVKKSVLIRQIREARVEAVQEARYRETIRGRMADAKSSARARFSKAREAAVSWWQGGETDPAQDESTERSGQPAKWVKVALWCGGIALGCVAGLIFALI